MKPFRFRLQRVLDVRRQRVGREREVLADAVRSWRDEGQALERVRQAYQEAVTDTREGRLGVISLADQVLWDSYLTRARAEVARQQDREQQAQDSLEEQRRRLSQAWLEQEIMERLHRRRQEEHRQNLRRAEQKEQDDISRNRPA